MAHKPLESVKRLECHFFVHQNRWVVVNVIWEDVTACRFKVKVNCARSTQCSKRGKHSPIFWGFGWTLAAKILQGILQSILPHCCILATLGHSQWRILRSELIDQGKSHSALASLQICRCHSGHRFAAWQTTHDQSMPFLFEETCQPDRGRRPQDT